MSIRSRLRSLRPATANDVTARLDEIRRSVEDLRADGHHDPRVAYLGGREAVVTTTWGRRLIVNTDDLIVGPELLSTGTFEPGLTAAFPRLISAGETVVDVGANIGYYSVLAGSIVGSSGFVVALEPHPGTARFLAVNLVLNGQWDNSSVGRLAASSSAGELEFFVRERFASNSSIGPVTDAELDHLGDSQESITVNTIDLDTHLGELGRLHDVRLVKIDVEGAELGVFLGAMRLLTEARPRVVFEWAPGQQRRAGHEPTQLLELLEASELDAAVIDGASGSFTPIDLASLTEIGHANVLLVPSGASFAVR